MTRRTKVKERKKKIYFNYSSINLFLEETNIEFDIS